VLLGDVQRERRAIDSGVVDEDVDPPELGARSLGHGLEVGARRHVGAHDAHAASQAFDLTGRTLRSRLVQLGDDDIGAHPGQLQRGGASDAAAGACNDRNVS
jgi:hypothetical protein